MDEVYTKYEGTLFLGGQGYGKMVLFKMRMDRYGGIKTFSGKLP
jgi:hypothetical protein